MKKKYHFNFIAVSFVILFIGIVNAVAQDHLYRVKLIRAAPGELLNVIDLYKDDMKNHSAYGIEKTIFDAAQPGRSMGSDVYFSDRKHEISFLKSSDAEAKEIKHSE